MLYGRVSGLHGLLVLALCRWQGVLVGTCGPGTGIHQGAAG